MKIVDGILHILDIKGNVICSFDNVEVNIKKQCDEQNPYVIIDASCNENVLNKLRYSNGFSDIKVFLSGQFCKITFIGKDGFIAFGVTNYENVSMVGVYIRSYCDKGK